MTRVLTLAIIGLFTAFHPALALTSKSAGAISVTKIVDGLTEPWAVGFLPDGGFLVTERGGRLLHFKDGARTVVRGVPRVEVNGQGGLLDVMIPRDFATTREVFLSYSKRQQRGAGTALAVGELSRDGARLRNVRTIFEMSNGTSGGRHFGSRIVEAADGSIFLTIGDRGARQSAQERSNHVGSIVRIMRNGSVPADNPFIGETNVRPEIWSYGHRNPQGASLDLNGNLWTAEHGAQGGDEVNEIRKGANFGWPVISYGRHYSGAKIGEGTSKPGMEQPAHFWDPSIAPSGMMVYSGQLWPEWRGDFFVGSLKFGLISRLEQRGNSVREAERLQSSETARVRDVREAPDGTIWFLSVGNGALYRMTPG